MKEGMEVKKKGRKIRKKRARKEGGTHEERQERIKLGRTEGAEEGQIIKRRPISEQCKNDATQLCFCWMLKCFG